MNNKFKSQYFEIKKTLMAKCLHSCNLVRKSECSILQYVILMTHIYCEEDINCPCVRKSTVIYCLRLLKRTVQLCRKCFETYSYDAKSFETTVVMTQKVWATDNVNNQYMQLYFASYHLYKWERNIAWKARFIVHFWKNIDCRFHLA